MPLDRDVSTATERWFLQRGLPHFINDYRAGEDIWTRTLPALTLVFVAEIVVNAPNESFPIWLDAVAVAGAFGVLVLAWTAVNRVRGRRPLARPDDLGPVELAFFVLVPAAVPLAFGGQVGSAVLTALVNLAVLGAIYLGTSYGIVPMVRWALGRFIRQLESVVSLLARALPLIALLVTFLFLSTEVWQTAGTLPGATYWIAVGLFPVVGVLFVVARLPRDVGALNEFPDPAVVDALVAGTPVAHAPTTGNEPPPLDRREWRNVGLVALFSQGVQIMLVSLMIGVFFVVLGLLLVDEATTQSWAAQVHVLAACSIGSRELVVTEQLLRVAGFLTAFSGLSFTVYLLTDETYRREFRDDIVEDLRQAFAVRAVYRALLAAA